MTVRPPPPHFAIRPYEADDALQMAQLYFDSVRQIGASRYNSDQVQAWAPAPADPSSVHARAMDGRTTLVARNFEGQVICYGDLEPDGHIDHLYCRPDAARTGVAPALLDELILRAAAQNIPRLYVEASELARPLFERKGFGLLRRRDFSLRGVPIHNYEMEMALA